MGGVVVGDRVELGANTTVDRALYGVTRVGDGCKLDNLVQVAHNVQLGPDCALAAQVGISGSVTIGRGSFFAGQVGLSDHIKVGERVSLAGGSGVSSNIPDGEKWGGYPAMPVMQMMRIIKAWPRLPDLLHRVRDLEKRLAVLEGEGRRGEGE
jgi:UDP-3-O-[3-hydroxymyristoyl] glucosamine N-acyltransferase